MTERAAPLWAIPAAFAVGGAIAWVVLASVPDQPPVAPAAFIRDPLPAVRDLVKSEAIAEAASRSVRDSVIEGLQRGDRARIAAGLTEDFLGELYLPVDNDRVEDGALTVWRMSSPPSRRLGPEAMAEGLLALAEPLASLDRARWRVFRSVASEAAPQILVQRVHFDLAGLTVAGARRQLKATLATELVPSGRRWLLRRWQVLEATWTDSRLPRFEDVSDATGIHFMRSADAEAVLTKAIDARRAFMAGGLSVIDFNRDGFPDLLASRAHDQVSLFLNDGAGGFTKAALPAIEGPSQVGKHYLFIDLDGDGVEELVSTAVVKQAGERAELGLYRFDSEGMRRVRGALPFVVPRWMREIDLVSAVPCDVDSDGRLDLFFVGYSHHDSKLAPSLIDARHGMRNLLFMNAGDLRFVEEGATRGISGERFSLMAGCQDFDRDGDPDLIVGNDYGPNDYFDNRGGGRFNADLAHPFHTGPSFSMGLAIADYDNTGHYTVSVSNMYSHAGQRIVPLAEGLPADDIRGLLGLAGGNRMFAVDDGWRDVSAEADIALADWAWGQQFFDVDNDADKDLVVVNGYTTHSDPTKPDY